MPHLIIDFSKGLEAQCDMQSLCEELLDTLGREPEIGGPENLKIRASEAPYVALGSGHKSFVHAEFLLMAGRSEEVQHHLSHVVLGVLRKHMPEAGVISVNPRDLNPATYARDTRAL